MAGFNLRIRNTKDSASEQVRGQSKKLMRGIKGIYSTNGKSFLSFTACSLRAEAVAGEHLHDHTQPGQHNDEVNRGGSARSWRQICPQRTPDRQRQARPAETCSPPSPATGRGRPSAGSRARILLNASAAWPPSSIQTGIRLSRLSHAPDRASAAHSGSCVCQNRRGAGQRGQKSRQGSGQADFRLSLDRHAHRLPAHVRAEAGQKHRHLSGQSAALDVDVVAHFVNQDQHGEADSESGSKRCPVKTEECDEAEKKLQLEDRSQQEISPWPGGSRSDRPARGAAPICSRSAAEVEPAQQWCRENGRGSESSPPAASSPAAAAVPSASARAPAESRLWIQEPWPRRPVGPVAPSAPGPGTSRTPASPASDRPSSGGSCESAQEWRWTRD